MPFQSLAWQSFEQYLICLHLEQTWSLQVSDSAMPHLPHILRTSTPPGRTKCKLPSRSGIISSASPSEVNTRMPSHGPGRGKVAPARFGFWIVLFAAVHSLQRRIFALAQCSGVYCDSSLDLMQQLHTFSIVDASSATLHLWRRPQCMVMSRCLCCFLPLSDLPPFFFH